MQSSENLQSAELTILQNSYILIFKNDRRILTH